MAVYDPFLGSGTTLVAAEQTGRVGFGLELEPKYVAVILERLAGMGLAPKLCTC
jgi:DNA modification methylase